MEILSFIIYLFVAAACAWIASALVPGTLPGGFFTAVVFGALGAWLGASLIGAVGPSLAGVRLLPAIVGSGILVFLFALVSRQFVRR